MKPIILVPTDFTELAKAGIAYACNLASHIDAEVQLMHIYPYPSIPAEVPSDFMHAGSEQLAKSASEKIAVIVEEFSEKYPGIVFKQVLDQGPIVSNITHYAEQENISLIVMSSNGAEGVRKWFVGSFSAGVVEYAKVPVLIVPDDYSEEGVPTRIVFATDYAAGEPGPLREVIALAKMIDAELLITHVNLGGESLPEEMFEWYKEKVEEEISYPRKSFFLIKGEELQETLESFVLMKEANMMVMSIKERSFWERVLSKSETKEMAYHPPVPLLTYHLSSFNREGTHQTA
ncbi:MAG: universal stress protein [Bacteroidota bacterium]